MLASDESPRRRRATPGRDRHAADCVCLRDAYGGTTTARASAGNRRGRRPSISPRSTSDGFSRKRPSFRTREANFRAARDKLFVRKAQLKRVMQVLVPTPFFVLVTYDGLYVASFRSSRASRFSSGSCARGTLIATGLSSVRCFDSRHARRDYAHGSGSSICWAIERDSREHDDTAPADEVASASPCRPVTASRSRALSPRPRRSPGCSAPAGACLS